MTAILAASFVYYVVPRIVGLGPTLRRLRSGRIGWLALGVGLEALSMFGDIVMNRGVFAARGTPIGWRRTADIRMAGAAVAIAPAGYASRAAGIRRIGVGYDGSVESGRALQLARTLAAHHQAELFAFEAIRSPVHERDPANVAGESQELVEEARRRIAALGGVHADASFGDAVDELRQYGQSVDLLVIGSHKYGPIDRMLEESTSQQLADEPSSPLLVLAAPGQVTRNM